MSQIDLEHLGVRGTSSKRIDSKEKCYGFRGESLYGISKLSERMSIKSLHKEATACWERDMK